MIDVHCHLNFKAFENDFDEIIKQAENDGVEIIINTGTSIESSRRAVELADQYSNLYAIVGIHPHHAGEELEIETLRQLARDSQTVAIGEIGLDHHQYLNYPEITTNEKERHQGYGFGIDWKVY